MSDARVIINLLDEDAPDALHCRYQGELEGQSCHIALDLEDGRMWADYNPEIGGGIPASVYNGRTRWWSIPCMTSASANQLMTEIKPLAERILVGSEIKWDGNNNVGILNEDAGQAEQEIRDHLGDISEYDYDRVYEIDTADWFADAGEDAPVELTADTTDHELAAMASSLESEATTLYDNGYTVLLDAGEYLRVKREEMRDQVREELHDVVEQLDEVTAKRDTLIRRLDGWGDSSRAIAPWAGLSHVGVQKIVKRIDK